MFFSIRQANKITDISAGSLPAGLREISLNYNPIKHIDDHAFDEVATTLESLYFTNAQISKIPDAFLHLDTLQNLNIMSTNVSDWNAAAMDHVGQTLQTLNLEEVGLTTWPVWIAGMENLNELSLADNAISSIPDSAFDKLSNNLQILTLSKNKFNAVPKSLSTLNNLTLLDLQHNKIINITWLPLSSKLSSLTLNHNHISDANHLSDLLRVYADSLSSVTLSHNDLKIIPDVSLLTKMNALDLSHNQISDPNSGTVHSGIFSADLSYNLLPSIPAIYMSLQSVSIMFLQYNLIHSVQGEDVPPWIVNLDLQHNLVTELSDTSFPVNCSLQDLTLDNNPLISISPSAFKNLRSLNVLSLQSTKLARLPLSLVLLKSVTYISLNDNSDLVCTCLEKSVQKVAEYIDHDGKCGLISIYNFLADLSPGCP